MKFKIKTSLLVTGFLLLPLPLMGMEEKTSTPAGESDQMGVEIETSSLKVVYKEGEDSSNRSGLKITHNDQDWWSLEEDTSDDRLESTAYNLELKTHGGFNKDEFLDVFKVIHGVLYKIYMEENIPDEKELTYKLGGKELRSIIKSIYDKSDFVVNKYGATIYLARQNRLFLRPQITYKLSLNKILQIFERLKEIKGFDKFLNSISAPKKRIIKPRSSDSTVVQPLVYVNKLKCYNILIFFRKLTISQRMVEFQFTENLKGFSYLFLHYWSELFNNCRLGSDDINFMQPGLKPFLYVMSRIPFSELYDNALSLDERGKFKILFDAILEEKLDIENNVIPCTIQADAAGDVCKIRQYIVSKEGEHKFNNDAGVASITLREWYDSIVELNKRIDGKDKLSPAPGLALTHGMGSYEWQDVRAPLIEVRGYTPLFGEKVGINNAEQTMILLYDFIIKECDWFFKLEENKLWEEEK